MAFVSRAKVVPTILPSPRVFTQGLTLQRKRLRLALILIGIFLIVMWYVFNRVTCNKRHPLLQINEKVIPSWNASVTNTQSSVTEHVFQLGIRFEDYVSIYKPLCIDSKDGMAYAMQGQLRCDASNKNRPWIKDHCKAMQIKARKEELLPISRQGKSNTWLKENHENIVWVDGITYIQPIESKSKNIAHYTSRILFLYHMMKNIEVYTSAPHTPKNVLVVPHSSVYERFKQPASHNFYHMNFLHALLSPHKAHVGKFEDFVKQVAGRVDNDDIIAHVVDDLTAKNEKNSKRYICFKKSVVPSFLNGRFFVNDYEYPAPQFDIPRHNVYSTTPSDSISFRKHMDSVLGFDSTPNFVPRKILFIERKNRVRAFSSADNKKLLKKLRSVAKKMRYSLKVVDFSDLTFSQQYAEMRNARLAIGVHGANLVNAIFMPELTTLFEIFPFGFPHVMYQHGGNAGLRYESYTLSTGQDYNLLNKFRSRKDCIDRLPSCKVHYRDSVLYLRRRDVLQIAKLVRKSLRNYERRSYSMICDDG